MSRISRFILLLLCLVIFAGCATTKTKGHYVDPNADFFGDKEKLEYPQKIAALNQMIDNLLVSQEYARISEVATKRAKERGHERPIMAIGSIEDNTQAGSSDLATAQIRRELKKILRTRTMFDVVDAVDRGKMTEDVLGRIRNGEKPDNIEGIGEYSSGDLFMFGELLRDDAAGLVYYHFMNFCIQDPIKGLEYWSDTVKVAKE